MNILLKHRTLAVVLLSFFALISCKQSENTIVVREAPTSSDKSDTTAVQQETHGSFKQLTIGEVTAIRSLDPLFIENTSGMRTIQLLYEGLVRYDENAEVIPAVAKDWTVSSDKHTYRFTLNNDIFYHDNNVFSNGLGRKLLASDVKFAFERMAKGTVPDRAAQLFMNIRGFEPYFQEQHQVMMETDRQLNSVNGIQVINDSTLTISLVEPDPNFLNKLATPRAVIYPKEAVINSGFKAVGSGPYKLSQKRSDSLYILARFENYRLPNQPKINRIDIRTGTDQTALMNAMNLGDIQLIPELGPRQIQMVTTNDGQLKAGLAQNYRLFDSKGAAIYALHYNSGSDVPQSSVASALRNVKADQFFPDLPQGFFQLNRLPAETTPAESVDSLGSTFSNDPFVRGFYSTLSEQLGQQGITFQMKSTRVPNRNTALYIRQDLPLYPQYQLNLSDNVLSWFSVQSLALAANEVEDIGFNEFPWWINLRSTNLSTENTR
jgi:ABC-type transport system substrate-binding protein